MEINDIIYGTFSIPEDIAAIVETPQFQRLKSIKQLGFFKLRNGLEHQHHRYSHCLGTYYAATRMLDALENNTEWLRKNNNKIPLVYRKAVQIAALLHDIAHAPFSHAWEHVVYDYDHECEASPCIDYIFEQVNEKFFPELRSNNNFGIALIKALIEGCVDNFEFKDKLPQQYKFIFEIVANKRLKIDVDKWDYLKRDHHYLSYLSDPNMDFDDVFLKARVSDCGSKIEYLYETYDKIYNLCAARYYFHIYCYTRPEVQLRDHIFYLAVRQTKPTINNISVCDIRAKNREEFLKFYDNNVLKLIEKSEFSKFLHDDVKFKEVNELPFSEKTIEAFVDVQSLQKYIPSPDLISFYGDKNNLPVIEDSTVNVRKTYTGVCDQSTLTVYYTIHYQ